ncbi:hypothetical protein ACJX0J_028168, partial [Zea mays]
IQIATPYFNTQRSKKLESTALFVQLHFLINMLSDILACSVAYIMFSIIVAIDVIGFDDCNTEGEAAMHVAAYTRKAEAAGSLYQTHLHYTANGHVHHFETQLDLPLNIGAIDAFEEYIRFGHNSRFQRVYEVKNIGNAKEDYLSVVVHFKKELL